MVLIALLIMTPLLVIATVLSAQAFAFTTDVESFGSSRPKALLLCPIHATPASADYGDTDGQLSGSPIRSRRSDKSGPNDSFSPRLIESLDLEPLFQGVARHAATKRGKDAILRLVNRASPSPASASAREKRSRREAALAATNSYKRIPLDQPADPIPDPIAILSIAQSNAEASDEYELIRQATAALESTITSAPSLPSGSTDKATLTLPPIYGGNTSPFDTTSPVASDDDEWLPLALEGFAGSLDKEAILKADKVVERLLQVYEWATSDSTIAAAPGISAIGETICVNQLQMLHDDIRDSVEIVRKRTISDPSGTKSFAFRFNGGKFPALTLLREKEDNVLADLDSSMQQLLKTRSFASKIESAPGERRKRSEAFDLDGRLVVSAPKRLAADMGVIRGYSKNGGMCYVEPKSIVGKGDELSEIREEIAAVETQIMQHQIASIARAAPFIERALDAMARIDVIFARAAFGSTLNGIIPAVDCDGIVDIQSFIHPVLALSEKSPVVPIDLILDSDSRSLIISGPNGGGKTLALKSFGVASTLTKVGVPIPTNVSSKTLNEHNLARVDFFRDVLIEVGDQQNVAGGESTLMARLNHMSSVIQRVSRGTSTHPLILLDELGGGTDPDAGSAIARAVLEKMMECSAARIVATTHSPQLKALSIEDDRFQCASVLLERSIAQNENSGFKRPTFRLQYGIIGDSYALGAASRCEPALPDDVISRAAELMAGNDEENGDLFRAMTLSLEREQEAAEAAKLMAQQLADETLQCRRATTALAQAYVEQFTRLENRLEEMYRELKDDSTKSAYDIVGESLCEIRHVKRKILSQREQLARRGLKMISTDYQFSEGESVVIVQEGVWDGESARVTMKDELDANQVAVIPSLDDWGWTSGDSGDESASDNMQNEQILILKRSEVALWDYPDADDPWGYVDDVGVPNTKSVTESRSKLLDTLSKLSTPQTEEKASSTSTEKNGSNSAKFTSSRERKAASAAAKKEKQRAKKKGKKKPKMHLANKPKS